MRLESFPFKVYQPKICNVRDNGYSTGKEIKFLEKFTNDSEVIAFVILSVQEVVTHFI